MNIDKILAPTDFSEMGILGLKAAQKFASTWNAKVVPFHSSGQNAKDDDKNGLADQLNEEAAKYIDKNLLEDGRISEDKAVDAINNAAADTDLVVMSTHGRTGFSRLLLGSIAEKVIRSCPKPVIVVEEEPRDSLDKILVTTDFSENSLKVFPFVQEIAQKTGAKIELKHIVSYELHQSMAELQGTQSKYNRRLQELADKHLSDVSDQVQTEVVPSNSSIHEEITRICEQNNYSMVMMATLGWTGLDYLRLGSTASNVVRHVVSPVFIINPKTQ